MPRPTRSPSTPGPSSPPSDSSRPASRHRATRPTSSGSRVVAAERLLEARLTPPGDPADVVRISAAIGTYRALLDVLEADAPVDARPTPDGPLSAEASLPVDSVDSPDEVDAVQTLRVHLARLEADRAMAQLGFALYDIACRGRSGADG